MENTFFVPAIVILALVSAVVPLSAHHSWPVNYVQARDGERDRDRVHVGKPAPDDYPRGSDQ